MIIIIKVGAYSPRVGCAPSNVGELVVHTQKVKELLPKVDNYPPVRKVCFGASKTNCFVRLLLYNPRYLDS